MFGHVDGRLLALVVLQSAAIAQATKALARQWFQGALDRLCPGHKNGGERRRAA
jgi:hypothetical protein